MEKQCPFCSGNILNEIVADHGSVFAVKDRYPVTDGHLLIIPKRHVEDFFHMSEEERRDAEELLFKMREEILRQDQAVIGFNVGMNCGVAAGQTISHGHIHLIPRRRGDIDDPRGGVRGVIPEKQKY